MRPIPDTLQKFLEETARQMTVAAHETDNALWSHLYQKLKHAYDEQKMLGMLHPALVPPVETRRVRTQQPLHAGHQIGLADPMRAGAISPARPAPRAPGRRRGAGWPRWPTGSTAGQRSPPRPRGGEKSV